MLRLGTLLFVTQILSVTCSETPRELNAMNVVTEAENFALRWTIQPTRLLILLTGKWFPREGMRLNASLLVMSTTPNQVWASKDFLQPIFLDVLAASLKTIVISAGPWYRGRPGSFLDPFQNFRHNCLLHIALGESEKPRREMFFVSTLYWKHDRRRVFHCIRKFDHMIYRFEEASLRSCLPKRQKRYRRSATYVSTRDPLELKLCIFLLLNTTTIEASFTISQRLKKPSHFSRHMVSLYATNRNTAVECFSYYHWRDTNLSAFIQPFKYDVWIASFVTTLIVVSLISWLRIDTFQSALTRVLLSFISVIQIRANLRKNSQLPILICAVTMCFFVGRIYTNSFMSFFLDQKDLTIRGRLFECHLYFQCFSHHYVNFHLLQSGSLCNMNSRQQSLAEKPLHRRVYRDQNRPQIQGERTYFIQRENRFRDSAGLWPAYSQLALVLTRVSSTIDRLLQAGIVSDACSESPETDVQLYLNSSRSKEFRSRLQRLRRFSHRLPKFIEFNSTGEYFDMDGLSKILPIFRACFLFSIVVFFYEIRVLIKCCRVWVLRRIYAALRELENQNLNESTWAIPREQRECLRLRRSLTLFGDDKRESDELSLPRDGRPSTECREVPETNIVVLSQRTQHSSVQGEGSLT